MGTICIHLRGLAGYCQGVTAAVSPGRKNMAASNQSLTTKGTKSAKKGMLSFEKASSGSQ
jgi:hypothetical protein